MKFEGVSPHLTTDFDGQGSRSLKGQKICFMAVTPERN